MFQRIPSRRGFRVRLALIMAAGLFVWLVIGCSESVNSYHAAGGSAITTSDRVLVLPFMDTRTFTDPNDPYRENLGEHAKDIFVAAMKENPQCRATVVEAPALNRSQGSLTIAEVAELGRANGADYVVAGQVFSFTETRAASIPPRAGMFVRIVSSSDGSLVFVGDHYQSAPIPGASGGRELQARQVADRLVESFSSRMNASLQAVGNVAGLGSALAYMPPASGLRMAKANNADATPEAPPPLPDFSVVTPTFDNASAGDGAPEVPPVLDYGEGDDFFKFSDNSVNVALVEPPAAPTLDSTASKAEEAAHSSAEAVVEKESEPHLDVLADAYPPVLPPPVDAIANEALAEAYGEEERHEQAYDYESEENLASLEEEESYTDDVADASDDAAVSENVVTAADMAMMSGDELAADLFEEEGVPYSSFVPSVPSASQAESVPAPIVVVAPEPEPVAEEYASSSTQEQVEYSGTGYRTQREYFEAIGEPFPDESTAIATEQPLTTATAPVTTLLEPDEVYAQAEPAFEPEPVVAASAPQVDFLSPVANGGAAVKVLLLPYHERENPDNLIPHTGGGEVVTALFGAKLAMESGVQVMWAGGSEYTHDRLVSIEEAVNYGRIMGVDYVVRGQVVEFRRAQSVPSFYSAVISTAILAAQIFFAEISGVDVATEVYRVSDGVCVMSRRDRSQQKYVVQAEKTVRRLAAGMANDVASVMRNPGSEAMDPLIDGLTTTSLFASAQ